MTITRFLGVLLLFLVLGSCNYKWALRYRKDGKRHIVKDYPNYINKDDGYEKFVFRTLYKQAEYSSTSIRTFKFYGDSLFVGDSVTYYFYCDSPKYIQIFKLGIISADLLRKYQPGSQRLIRKEIKTGKRINEDLSMEKFTIYGLEELHNMRTKKNTRRYKYTIALGSGFDTYCFELKNEKANRKTPIDSFIKGAHLTFFRHSPFHAI